VQHHHAHIAALMAEHGCDGMQRMLGFAFDGTGFGPDGAVWGGEVLLADYKGYRRIAALKYVPLVGGDLAVARPYRMALAHLWAAGLPWNGDLPPELACPSDELRVLRRQLETGLGSVPTSSMGRLFDAVSALAGVCQVASYEAQAAVQLEALARSMAAASTPYRFSLDTGRAPAVIDAGPVIAAVAADVRGGTPAAVVGARFHRAVAELIVELATLYSAEGTAHTIALSGGVFQNPLLLTSTLELLQESGINAITHRRVPPNDGGIALGQLVAGASG
jgi:hydrogenase maturation protein HypF